ncbi:MAG: transcriptional regulator, LacI family [Herbinix sp.]|jgi:LacI family transcriptional regulator|nr:transcriptional regulator, LacI family [Herbinix sp.]
MANIKEIAKACDVSISTVSNVLNNKKSVKAHTRELILETAKRMEYVPNYMAKNLKQKATQTIGIIAEDLTVFNCPEIVDGIHAYLEEMGYSFLLGNLRLYKKYGNKFYITENYKTQVIEEFRMMQAKQVNGIIYIGAHNREIHCIPNDLLIPVVIAYGFASDDNIPSVILNDEKAAYDATNALIEKGHQLIGVIAGEDKSIHTKERLRGFQRALYQHKLLYNPELIYQGNWVRASGYQGTAQLVQMGVTAIFAMNDNMALGIYDYAYEHGIKIGSELSIIGMDNKEISTVLRPSLTTMALPLNEIGKQAARIIIEICKKQYRDDEHIHKIECNLVERESIGKTF